MTITNKPSATENKNNDEFMQARDKLQKGASNGLPTAAPVEDVIPEPLHQEIGTNQTHSNDARQQQKQQKQQERALGIITWNDNLEDIIKYIKSHDFKVLDTKTFQLSTNQVKEFDLNHQNEPYDDKYTIRLNTAVSYALILEKENAINEWKKLMGPCNYNESCKKQPDSIRTRFAKDGSQCIIYGSDSEASAKKEIEFIFSSAVIQKDDSQLEPETSCSNSEYSATIYHDETPSLVTRDTVSSVEEKANNVLDPNTNIISCISMTDQEKKMVKPEVSIVDGSNITQKDQSANDSTSQSKTTPFGRNNADDKAVDKYASIDEIKDKKPHDYKLVEEEMETTVDTTGNSAISTANAKKDVNHDKNDSSDDIQVNHSKPNTDITFDIRTENGLVTKDSSTIPQSKEEQQFDSIPIDDKEKNSMDISLTKEKDDCQVQDEITDEKNEAVLAPKNEQDSSEKSERAFASSDKVASINKQSIKDTLNAKEKVHSLQTTPTSSAKNKLLIRSTKGDAVRPSSSRIRPPSIKRSQNGTMISSPKSLTSGTKQPLAPEQRLHTTSINGVKTGAKGHASAGATRIARLSSISSIKSSSSSEQEKKPPGVTKTLANKPLTKVSKRLPRVATIESTQKPLSLEHSNESTAEKPKKRVSSTKSFITRLTKPTVASSNKKLEHHEVVAQKNPAGVVRRTTLAKKQCVEMPSKSTGISKPMQQKKENPSDSSAVTGKTSTENNNNDASTSRELHQTAIMNKLTNADEP